MRLIYLLGLLCAGYSSLHAQTITVMTYNIHHGLSEWNRINMIRVGEIIREQKPDLVAVQEIDSATTRSFGRFQMEQLANLTGVYPVFGKAINFQSGAYGIGILSKYPIIAWQAVPLPNPDSTEQRVCLCAYVELPNSKTIRFCNTHLDHRSVLNRNLQLATVHQMLKNSIQPVIWAGDLNARADEIAMQQILDNWIDAGRYTEAATLHHGNARIDYILTLPLGQLSLLEYKVLDEPVTSDHHPVLATYELK